MSISDLRRLGQTRDSWNKNTETLVNFLGKVLDAQPKEKDSDKPNSRNFSKLISDIIHKPVISMQKNLFLTYGDEFNDSRLSQYKPGSEMNANKVSIHQLKVKRKSTYQGIESTYRNDITEKANNIFNAIETILGYNVHFDGRTDIDDAYERVINAYSIDDVFEDTIIPVHNKLMYMILMAWADIVCDIYKHVTGRYAITAYLGLTYRNRSPDQKSLDKIYSEHGVASFIKTYNAINERFERGRHNYCSEVLKLWDSIANGMDCIKDLTPYKICNGGILTKLDLGLFTRSSQVDAMTAVYEVTNGLDCKLLHDFMLFIKPIDFYNSNDETRSSLTERQRRDRELDIFNRGNFIQLKSMPLALGDDAPTESTSEEDTLEWDIDEQPSEFANALGIPTRKQVQDKITKYKVTPNGNLYKGCGNVAIKISNYAEKKDRAYIEKLSNDLKKPPVIQSIEQPTLYISDELFNLVNEHLKEIDEPEIEEAKNGQSSSQSINYQNRPRIMRDFANHTRVTADDLARAWDLLVDIRKDDKSKENVIDCSLTRGCQRMSKMSVKEALDALTHRQAAGRVKSDVNYIRHAYDLYEKEILDRIDESLISKQIATFKLTDYIKKIKSQKTAKGKILERVQKISKTLDFNSSDVELITRVFQKAATDEAKAEGMPKPRLICPAVVQAVSNKIRDQQRSRKQSKKIMESYYNLYCAYISDQMVRCIKDVTGIMRDSLHTFVHGQNGKQLVELISRKRTKLCEILGCGYEDLCYISFDYEKYDSSRTRATLKNFDNQMINNFITKAGVLLKSAGFMERDIEVACTQLTQLDVKVLHQDANNNIAFLSQLLGTVASGLAARTTLGNTAWNSAMSLTFTEGQTTATFASGDDGFIMLHKSDYKKVLENMAKFTSKENPANGIKNGGSGCIIGKDLRVDDKIITFQSKVICPDSHSCVRRYEKYVITGLVSKSTTPQAIRNWNNLNQLKEYFDIPFYRSTKKFLESQDCREGKQSKLEEYEKRFTKDFSTSLNPPWEYINRQLKITEGKMITQYDFQNDAKQLEKLADANRWGSNMLQH